MQKIIIGFVLCFTFFSSEGYTQESLYKTHTQDNSRYLVHKVFNRLGCFIFDFSTAPIFVTIDKPGENLEWIKMDYYGNPIVTFIDRDSICNNSPDQFHNCMEIWQNVEDQKNNLYWFRYTNWKISEGRFSLDERDGKILITDVKAIKFPPTFAHPKDYAIGE